MKKFRALLLSAALLGAGIQQATAEWVSIGQGVYYEGLLTYYGEEMGIKRGMSWPVNIEEDSDTKGLYRLAPYSGKNPIAELFGSSDDSSYMVIHAEDPAKVWMEDFDSYDQYYCFTHMVPESGWEGEAAEYGTLSDGIISFPAMCMATIDLTDPEGLWHSANREGECKIVIPGSGSEIEDYSLYLDYNYCGVNNKVPVTITAGSSVKSVKYVLQEGLVEADSKTETNADLDAATMQLVAAEGKEIAAGKQTVECSVHGLHSMLVIAMDADGKAHTGKVAYIYGDRSDDSEWTSLGKVKYNEDLFAGYYEGLPQVELQVELQENKNTQGYYRLVNPYAEYEGNCIENHDGHNHYMYIHAEDPQAVWVENSPIGIDFGDDYGEARVTSNVALMLEYGLSLEEAIAGSEEGIGQINNNVIEFPAYGLWIGQTGWFNGYWTSTGQNFRVHLPEVSGIDSITSDKTAETDTQYFNLQGIRIDRPAAGLFIEKRGNNVTKRIVR